MLVKQTLESLFPPEVLAKSTYTTSRGTFIRLINTKEALATIPALYPNLSLYRKHLSMFSDVRPPRVDYLNGRPTGNRKIDLLVDLLVEPVVDLPLPTYRGDV